MSKDRCTTGGQGAEGGVTGGDERVLDKNEITHYVFFLS